MLGTPPPFVRSSKPIVLLPTGADDAPHRVCQGNTPGPRSADGGHRAVSGLLAGKNQKVRGGGGPQSESIVKSWMSCGLQYRPAAELYTRDHT